MANETANFSQDKFGMEGDEFYQFLISAHEGLTLEESTKLNARLVLIMANQIGDIDVLREIITKASEREV